MKRIDLNIIFFHYAGINNDIIEQLNLKTVESSEAIIHPLLMCGNIDRYL